MNILYIILKHVIWRFQIYNLFREIFKFREDKSNNVFREIRKCFHKTESPDHVLHVLRFSTELLVTDKLRVAGVMKNKHRGVC